MDEMWDFKIAKRVGSRTAMVIGPRRQKRQFLEYPGSMPDPVELPPPMPVKGPAKSDGEASAGDSGFKVSHASAFSLEDYVLNYVSDDDEPRT